MKKYLLLLLLISPAIAKAQNAWGMEVWNAYIGSCVETAKTGMTEKMAYEYCSCTATKLEFRYPNAYDLSSVQQEEITELATICLEEVNTASSSQKTQAGKGKGQPPKPMSTAGKTNKTNTNLVGPTNWSKSGYDSYMKSCVDSAKQYLSESEAKKYCDCTAAKVQNLYPDENKVYLTDEEINQVSAECLNN